MPHRVFITAAEVSGDRHAAQLIRSLKEMDPQIQIEGHGGPAMAAAGATIHHETTRHAAMAAQALWRIWEMLRLLRWTRQHFRRNPPDLQVCVDSPAMNFHFAKLARRSGVPVLYYVAPQLWAWREGRMHKLRQWVDQVACILPFEQEYFRRHGVNATFVGHPLFDELPADRPRAQGGLPAGRPPVVGLLAGSRRSEATHNFPHLLDVARRIRQAVPGVTFLAPTTPATDPLVRRTAGGLEGFQVAENAFNEMVPRCDLCITVSGTAALHVAAFGVPMIVVYRASPVLWQIFRWIIKTRTYSLVNLLAMKDVGAGGERGPAPAERIVPEFIPWYGSNEPVARLAIEMLTHPQLLAEQSRRLAEVIRPLDHRGASGEVARIALEMIDGHREPHT